METPNSKTDWLFWGGVAVGVFVMITGIVALVWRDVGTTEARLILCSGLGILLGAFGSTAVVKYKGLTITGVAAIAVVLLYVVVTLTKSQVTFGSITGDIKGAIIEVKGDKTYLGAMRDRDRSYEFVIDGSGLDRPFFDVYITFPAGISGQGEQEIIFEGIDKKYVEHFLGSGRRIEWRFSRQGENLVEAASREVIAEVGLPKAELPTMPRTSRGAWGLVGNAFAQNSPSIPPPPPPPPQVFIDLGSGASSVRRTARSMLADLGPSAVSAMMQELRENQGEYRIRLGILVALADMLRKDKKAAPEVSHQLTSEDLQLIVKALNDPDRTIRVYAGEFLYDLGDPRVVPLALAAARDEQTTPDGLYLDLFVIKGAYRRLSPSEQKETWEALQAIRPNAGAKAQELIDSLAM
jgi:hypothetical protein